MFLAENTFRIIMYGMWGIITLQAVKQAVMLVPCMLIGLGLGIGSAKVLDDKFVKKFVIIMLMISGLALVINN